LTLVNIHRWFRGHSWTEVAANDSRWHGPLDHAPEGEQEVLHFRILDFDLHARDLGLELATELQNQVLERLRCELSAAETLVLRDAGRIDLHVREAAGVDLEKFSEHLMDRVYGEAFSVARALVECELVLD
jgi:hypothetical protein